MRPTISFSSLWERSLTRSYSLPVALAPFGSGKYASDPRLPNCSEECFDGGHSTGVLL